MGVGPYRRTGESAKEGTQLKAYYCSGCVCGGKLVVRVLVPTVRDHGWNRNGIETVFVAMYQVPLPMHKFSRCHRILTKTTAPVPPLVLVLPDLRRSSGSTNEETTERFNVSQRLLHCLGYRAQLVMTLLAIGGSGNRHNQVGPARYTVPPEFYEQQTY